MLLGAMSEMAEKYGECGWNPALACGYISFAVSQYNYPNIKSVDEYVDQYGFEPTATSVNHYLWAYMVAPFIGAVIAGILHLIH